ncbi:indoleacetamide hydrolase [Pseudonocardia yuanmonensis]|uniref:Indoleacetamide hydrolase n=1 Tax=Pseudonocardia yuanmonensis TaxID=1095914 RepID=A0ABP8WQ43_9PSEU
MTSSDDISDGIISDGIASRLASGAPGAVLDETRRRAEELAHLGAFLALSDRPDQARDDRERAAGPLAGVPVAVKDNIDTADLPTTGATAALAGSRPARDHVAVARLRAAGAVVVGKTNLHELAFGITCNNAHTGPVRNPHDPDRIAGGSSGGSAVAVATGVVPVALGSDTGGSMRVPAAHCGVVGFRPTVGRWGSGRVVPLSSTRDTVGVFARTVADAALVDRVVVDAATGTATVAAAGTATDAVPDRPEPDRLRLGIPRTGFWEDLDPDVDRCAAEVLDRLADAGAELVEVDLAAHELDARCGFPIVLYEVVRELPGYLAGLPGPHRELRLDEVVEQVASPDVRALLEAATAEPVPDDAYRVALAVRDDLRKAYTTALGGPDGRRLDALVYPTVPLPPAPLGHDATTPHNGRDVPVFLTNVRNTAPGSAAGMPAVSLPAGRSTTGLPIGISLEGLPGEDRALLAAAQRVEATLRQVGRT